MISPSQQFVPILCRSSSPLPPSNHLHSLAQVPQLTYHGSRSDAFGDRCETLSIGFTARSSWHSSSSRSANKVFADADVSDFPTSRISDRIPVEVPAI